MRKFWNKLGHYEKTVLMLLLGFVIFCLGHFSYEIFIGFCPLCQNEFRSGETCWELIIQW